MKRRRMKAYVWMIAVLCYMLMNWTVAFLITRWVYGLGGWNPPELVRQLVTGVIGFFMWGMTMVLVGRLFNSRRSDFFRQALDAIRRIAKGDFNVSIQAGGQGIFFELLEGINHMAGELSQMEKLRQEFISNVSHEFQSPLASIGGFARALGQDGLGAEERKRYLEIIETECRRLSRLSDNLMKLTALESEQHPFDRKPYRLDKQLRDVILRMEPQWSAKDLEMEADLAEAVVQADEELMGQVWTNLLHNAIKFTPERGTVRVRVEAGADGKGGRVTVTDTGIGMSEEDQAHMFERFYKADKSRERSRGGSGLGLAIVKKIVDKHQGRINVAGAPGAGTEVAVELP